MTKEEIEKAIENGESVWFADDCNKRAWEIGLNKRYKPEIYSAKTLVVYEGVNNRFKRDFFIEKLYKTKAEAEHYLRHANVTRTEQLPFLTWEEFLKRKRFHFIDKFGNWYGLLINSEDRLLLRQEDTFNVFRSDATEEDYYKAYDECVRLFLGRED